MYVKQVIEDGQYDVNALPIRIASRGNLTQLFIGTLPVIEVRTLDLLQAIETESMPGNPNGHACAVLDLLG